MKILFNDIIQYSDADTTIKSPSLADYTTIKTTLTIRFDTQRPVNCIGIGNCDKSSITVTINGVSRILTFTGNGLYLLDKTYTTNTISVKSTAAFTIGRLAAGLAVHIPTALAKEPAFCSTAQPRTTLSGQIIQGLGGYNYKQIALDSRYKINQTAMDEIMNGYKYIAQGYPFFVDLSDEAYKLPFSKFYGIDLNQQKMSFEGGIKKYLYSRRWEFKEAF